MKNCKHNTFHNDCCVCWFKQSVGDYYSNDVILFMDKMAALLMNKDWSTYCMERALSTAKDKFKGSWSEMFSVAEVMDAQN